MLFRSLSEKEQILEKEKKDISKNKDSSLFERSKKISEKISKYVKQQNSVKKELDDILSSIPNIALKDVPVGKDESSNKEISKVEKYQNLNLNPNLIMSLAKSFKC